MGRYIALAYLHEGRISQRAFDWFCLFSDWAAPRFSGTAGFKQERLYNRRGRDFYYRRIERIRALHDAVKSGRIQLSH